MLVKPLPNIHSPINDGRTFPTVDENKTYVVVGLVMDDVRIVDDNGEPILVPCSRFLVLDDWIPDDWLQEANEAEGWHWSGPPQCAEPGFFERWHEGSVRERQILSNLYTELWHHHREQVGAQEMVLKR